MMLRAASLGDRQIWSDLLALAERRDGEQALVRGLLEIVRQSFELEGAAVYSRSEGGYRQEAVVGSGNFPPELGDPADHESAHHDSADHTYGSLPLPDGLLLVTPVERAARSLDGLPVVALATALQMACLSRRLKQQKFEVDYRGVELEALYDVGLAIASTLNLEQLGEEILLRAVSLLDARRGALYLTDQEHYVLDRTFGGDAQDRIAVDDLQVSALLQSETTVRQDLLPDAAHLLAVPIGEESAPQGLLVVADKESRSGVGPFGAGDRRTLLLLANQAAIALENAYLHRQALEKERLEREIELAAEIQRRLLPTRVPELEGFEVTGWSRPARHVGGDYYDLLPLAEDRLAIVLADVSGKGLPAALMVSTVHSALRVLIDQGRIGPQLIDRLNHHIVDSSAPNKFITLLALQLEVARGEVNYVNAGHNPGLLLRSGGDVAELVSGGFPLGLFSEGSYEGGAFSMEPGDLLCLYSDGITECESPAEEEFGLSRLLDLLNAVGDRNLHEVVQAVDTAVTDFAAGMSQGDDQTLVLLRRTS